MSPGCSSESTVGITRITLQFSLNRSLNGAARDVHAAINAARADLPTSLRQNPSYYKVNPAAAPVAILAMTSENLTRGQIYDAASKVVQQALSQIEGVGRGADRRQLAACGPGRAEPACALQIRHRSLEDVRAALASANAPSPKGAIEDGDRRLQIYTNDKANHAEDYRPLVIAYRDGAAVRLSDVAEVENWVENVRNQGLADGKPAVVVILRPATGCQRHRHRRAHKSRAGFSLAELNAAIRGLLDELNNRVMRSWGTSRRALFEQLDKPALRSLPPLAYEYSEWKRCRVGLDYHVEIAKHYYSVSPHSGIAALAPRHRPAHGSSLLFFA